MYNGLNQKGKLTLIQINGVQNSSMFEHNKTLGISYAQHMLLKLGPPLYYKKLHSLTVKKNYHLI